MSVLWVPLRVINNGKCKAESPYVPLTHFVAMHVCLFKSFWPIPTGPADTASQHWPAFSISLDSSLSRGWRIHNKPIGFDMWEFVSGFRQLKVPEGLVRNSQNLQEVYVIERSLCSQTNFSQQFNFSLTKIPRATRWLILWHILGMPEVMLIERLICDVSRKIHRTSKAVARLLHLLWKWIWSYLHKMFHKQRNCSLSTANISKGPHHSTNTALASQCKIWCLGPLEAEAKLNEAKSWTNFMAYQMLTFQQSDYSNIATF